MRAVLVCDATAYEHPADVPLHVVICETMQRALSVEPQVAIVCHLARRLHERGLMVPQRVSVDLVFRGPRSIQHVGRMVDPTLETARDSQYWRQARTLRLRTLQSNSCAVLLTHVSTFGRHELGEFDSGLTHPTVLWELTGLAEGEELEFWYELGSSPKVRVRREKVYEVSVPGTTFCSGKPLAYTNP